MLFSSRKGCDGLETKEKTVLQDDFKDEEIAKSQVGRLKTEVLIEKDGIGESWESLMG